MTAAAVVLTTLAAATAAVAAGEATVKLATFDNAPGTTQTWKDTNDPVMGGQSKSSFAVEESAGHFKGTCAIVPFLKAPGFCKITTSGGWLSSGEWSRWFQGFSSPKYNDASAFIDGALYLDVETTTPEYTGFKVGFTAKHAVRPGGFHFGGTSFKAGFNVSGTARTTVKVPFNSFSVDWSDYTGRCDTKDPNGEQHHCCGPEHPEVCPTATHLSEITGLELWSEGVAGDFDIRLFSIGAGPLTSSTEEPQESAMIQV